MPSWSKFDIEMMSRAIQLAERGRYTTRPNPCVGCVIVKDGIKLAEGYHQKAGFGHAEVNALAALKSANLSAIGATAYVTLEPCSHFGRTPPCAQTLVESGVAKVVVAITDANPQVAGKGIAMLREAGIAVEVGLLQAQALELNLGFMKRMRTGLPWVTVKLAASLDGKTALSNGVSKWITGDASRNDVQKLRARSCALITGIETVLADDPSLNVRYQSLGSLKDELDVTELHQPVRIVLDSKARLTADKRLFSITSPIILVSTQAYPETVIFPAHVQCLQFAPDNDGRVPLISLFHHLGKSYNQVLIEAGATLAGKVLELGLGDELYLYQAMKILGSHGRNLVQLPDYQAMDDIPSLQLKDSRQLGEDRRYIFRLGKE
ncbi:5-amino-6-(5-phosphoribosylamino)uracil reductase / diaminohydroxyphosphoribosylaminopyrimidine deaminase [Shewanella denitrificans OS217]|jgi:diaminohydroxyphosphoribosylaminopyrimidine deaminase / 5-amino-6-(5-phosphoribosylamino)uracil reductase|uniref:Riboflavin biosynthesis protein RibD n=1 Tax=Shewanella denitrificans (strain OS217 / ATCC BAA-1090 / DSM 15013) TaxID=318161 RepID=Q12Q46_SHEDO|nr:bifunctional diaminohydroxyphosphoribosylaminopyrimidine deaminase/5-amino-6-(5-phosphoribosylamino)uracil reductase RibD [Shewanella denitrificans]ABE54430.1 5-amino-6-(5-phosphoribosylamino)uracil reductase / diaminohydroxyphosphoribosylaminopyrimidine deaminase [Shewanella denitrificans OS217]